MIFLSPGVGTAAIRAVPKASKWSPVVTRGAIRYNNKTFSTFSLARF